MRQVGLFATLLVISGCAPTDASAPSGGETTTRRCHSSVSVRLIARQPDRVYIRTRTGQALELTGQPACLDVSGDGAVDVRPAVGPRSGDICIGDAANLTIAAPAGLRACNVRVARVVPNSEIEALPNRQSP